MTVGIVLLFKSKKMNKIDFKELKERLLALPKIEVPVQLDACTKVIGHELFIKSHIKMVETAQFKTALTNKQKAYKLYCIAPAYFRLLSYYNIRIAM